MTLTPDTYFAAGTTLANMTNLQLTLGDPFQVLDNGRIPLVAPVKTRSLDGLGRRDGKINSRLLCDVAADSGRIALNTLLFGNQTTDSKELYISAIDENGYYSPFLAFVDRPVELEDYRVASGGYWVTALVLPLYHLRIQSATKTSNYTVTTSDRLLYANTASGSITFTLPAVAGVTPYTIYRFHKTSASNNMVLDGNGSETINGATTHTTTANDTSVSIYTPNNTAWFTL